MWAKTTSARASLWRSNCATDARRAARNDCSSPSKDLLAEINVLAFDVPADAEYGGIRSMLETAENPIGGNDLLIAAHAYTTGATIVTANTAEFKRIPGLNVENWLA
jgi:predicted nucleic acid-binding protein